MAMKQGLPYRAELPSTGRTEPDQSLTGPVWACFLGNDPEPHRTIQFGAVWAHTAPNHPVRCGSSPYRPESGDITRFAVGSRWTEPYRPWKGGEGGRWGPFHMVGGREGGEKWVWLTSHGGRAWCFNKHQTFGILWEFSENTHGCEQLNRWDLQKIRKEGKISWNWRSDLRRGWSLTGGKIIYYFVSKYFFIFVVRNRIKMR